MLDAIVDQRLKATIGRLLHMLGLPEAASAGVASMRASRRQLNSLTYSELVVSSFPG